MCAELSSLEQSFVPLEILLKIFENKWSVLKFNIVIGTISLGQALGANGVRSGQGGSPGEGPLFPGG
jgi:hypothetical protein